MPVIVTRRVNTYVAPTVYDPEDVLPKDPCLLVSRSTQECWSCSVEAPTTVSPTGSLARPTSGIRTIAMELSIEAEKREAGDPQAAKPAKATPIVTRPAR